MYPEDRVLVGFVRGPEQFARIVRERWYHMPAAHAPKGRYAEVIAFYFGAAFGDQRYTIRAFATNVGQELVRRRALFPEAPDHPRADDVYLRLALGPIQWRDTPIVSLRWRRITFIHTTWDRFVNAREVGDLVLRGRRYVNRRDAVLRQTPSRYADSAGRG